MPLAISAFMFLVWVVSLASSHTFQGFSHAFLAAAMVTACAAVISKPPKASEKAEA